jgi:hypothetical protein
MEWVLPPSVCSSFPVATSQSLTVLSQLPDASQRPSGLKAMVRGAEKHGREDVPTFGGHNLLAPDKLAELLAGIGTAVDKAGGGFTMRYTTVVITATGKAVTA